MRVLVGAASQRHAATSGAKSFFSKIEQVFHGIRGSPEVGDAVFFHNFRLGFQVLSERSFLLLLPMGFD